jgi:hypothetical protein
VFDSLLFPLPPCSHSLLPGSWTSGQEHRRWEVERGVRERTLPSGPSPATSIGLRDNEKYRETKYIEREMKNIGRRNRSGDEPRSGDEKDRDKIDRETKNIGRMAEGSSQRGKKEHGETNHSSLAAVYLRAKILFSLCVSENTTGTKACAKKATSDTRCGMACAVQHACNRDNDGA